MEKIVMRDRHTTDTTAGLQENDVEALKASVQGQVLRPEDEGYDSARRVWNGMIDKRPALVVRCTDAGDVRTAVEFARTHQLLLAVCGGGHNVAGNAVCDGGLMIDLSPMKHIEVDPEAHTARAQPGLTWGEFDRATQAHGLATTGGLVSTTGIAGFTLGGGLGWLMRSYGLACDNLVSADVITADGRQITASADENPDLFWGIRGGGGNFGIVTSFTFKLYPVTTVFAGVVVYPWEQAKQIVRRYRDFARTAPDELTAHILLICMPDGTPAVAIAACYNGAIEAGEAALKAVRSWGPPLDDGLRPMPYVEFQSMFDAANPTGSRYYWKSSVLKELSDEAIDTLVDHFPSVPSPRSSVLIEQLGGAVRRVGDEDTAYTHRSVDFDFLIASVWDDPEQDGPNVAWAREINAAVEPFARQMVYVNYLGDEGEDRVRAAYGSAKYERLVSLKNTYDPTNLFHLNQNIKPSSPGQNMANEG
jgi:FAD/FMN-containing dehydrogenase